MIMEILSFAAFMLLLIGAYVFGRIEGKREAEKKLPLRGNLSKAHVRFTKGYVPRNIFFLDCVLENIEITDEIEKMNGFAGCISGLPKQKNRTPTVPATPKPGKGGREGSHG